MRICMARFASGRAYRGVIFTLSPLSGVNGEKTGGRSTELKDNGSFGDARIPTMFNVGLQITYC